MQLLGNVLDSFGIILVILLNSFIIGLVLNVVIFDIILASFGIVWYYIMVFDTILASFYIVFEILW